MSNFLTFNPRTRRPHLVVFVRCALTGAALAGAQVHLVSEDPTFKQRLRLQSLSIHKTSRKVHPPLDMGTTSPDGVVWFQQLSVADYEVRVDLPGSAGRYGPATTQVTLMAGDDGSPLMATVVVNLSPTALKGGVTGGNGPVVMAEVCLDEGTERTFTDADGAYHLVAVQPGQGRKVVVKVRGETVWSEGVDVVQGVATTLNLALSG